MKTWVYGLTAPFAGSIVDRIRRKRTILGGLYARSTIAILTPVSRTFQQLLCFMAAEGLGETFYYPASMSMPGSTCANCVALVLLSWMPKFLYDKFHMGLAMAGLSATLFVQLASMVGSPLGGWFADLLCGATKSIAMVVAALTAWRLFKGLYDANNFASIFDVIPAQARGTAAGFMSMVGWLGGGGVAPVVIGVIAAHYNLGIAISLAGFVYVAAGILLVTAGVHFAPGDVARCELVLQTDHKP